MTAVLFKTITNLQFNLDIEPEITIGAVKERIQEARGVDDYPAERLKLIYNGKILTDEMTFNEVGYDAKKFIVVMPMKKPAPAPTPAPSTPAVEAPSTSQTPTLSSEAGNNDASSLVTPAPASGSLVTPAAPKKKKELTPEQEQQVDALLAMGYPRRQIVRALRSAYWDSNRAVEYLINGLPDDLISQAALVDRQLTEQEAANAEPGEPIGDAATAEPNRFAGLAAMPEFQALRQMVQQNPEMLPQVLQVLTEVQPGLAQLIQENPDALLRLLNGEDPTAAAPALPPGAPRNSVVVSMTHDEVAAVQRLKNMGFQEQLCIEAFIACDKNEEHAVNYILSRMDEDYGH
ncbi:unnamed protein product, partial [Mesorhabditis spiculigera]